MSERKINLEEILNNSYLKHKEVWGLTPIDNKYENVAKDAILDFGKQLLELASENATTKKKSIRTYVVDKQSILDTIKQVI